MMQDNKRFDPCTVSLCNLWTQSNHLLEGHIHASRINFYEWLLGHQLVRCRQFVRYQLHSPLTSHSNFDEQACDYCLLDTKWYAYRHMEYCKEARSRNHFNRSKDGEQILLENICVVLDTKIVIQELNVEYTVPVDSTRTHGNYILATELFQPQMGQFT